MILFFDTETTGKPKNFKAKPQDVDNWPRVVQLAWALYNEEGALVRGFQFLVKPDGWTIEPEAEAVHGISLEKADAEGRPVLEVLQKFIYDYEQSHTLVAHNLNFDYPVVAAELLRAQVQAKNRVSWKVCTMMASTSFCNIPGKFGKQKKWPKLEELHKKLFEETFEGAHDAMVDVTACARCFFELSKRGVIRPKTSYETQA